jgi:digeranylgeranylglycerophospholipid reductase
VRRDGRETDLTTRLLIGADGAQSFVAKWSGVRRVQSEPALGLGALVSLPALAPETVRVFVGRAVAPSFFAWLIPAGGGMARLGIGCGDGARPATHLRRLVEAYPALFRGMEVCSYSGGLIPLVTLDRIVADNVMLVGDAAGQIKPTSGGGIYTSLVGARHCARVAAEALTRGDVRAAALAPYQTAWEADMGGEMSRGWDLRAAVLDLSDAELDRLVGILRSARLGALIARHGDIDYPSRLASRLVRARPLLYGFLRIALRGSWPALPRLPQRHASGHHAPPSGRSDPVKQRGSWFSSRP